MTEKSNQMLFCQSGVNLGGWISQYRTYDHTHFQTFIKRDDIAQIASWGMDHVRLPVDYPVLEDDTAPFDYKESGFDYIENCLAWCAQNNLSLVLDLHKAPGYSFGETIEGRKPMPLFEDDHVAERFYRLWEAIARRFQGRYPDLHFELLNEVNLDDGEPWNRMIKQAVQRIWTIDPNRTIVVGGNHFCSVNTLKDLLWIDDPRIVYTFHFYEPFLFTHQGARWTPVVRDYNQPLSYPGDYTDLGKFLENNPQYAADYGPLVNTATDQDVIRQHVSPALEFQKRSNTVLYCGEYGVIDTTDPASRRSWHRDFLEILKEAGIGRAVWSYKQMNFGLVDENSRVIDPELVKIVAQ
jgi:aryl-phospho-beta-D-glucosidase BglC (GH1 family)